MTTESFGLFYASDLEIALLNTHSLWTGKLSFQSTYGVTGLLNIIFYPYFTNTWNDRADTCEFVNWIFFHHKVCCTGICFMYVFFFIPSAGWPSGQGCRPSIQLLYWVLLLSGSVQRSVGRRNASSFLLDNLNESLNSKGHFLDHWSTPISFYMGHKSNYQSRPTNHKVSGLGELNPD